MFWVPVLVFIGVAGSRFPGWKERQLVVVPSPQHVQSWRFQREPIGHSPKGFLSLPSPFSNLGHGWQIMRILKFTTTEH